MPYDAALAARVERLTAHWDGPTSSRKMFGGIGHLLNGHMVCGVWREWLILRLGESAAASALALPGVAPMDITGRPMTGWVMVAPEALPDDDALAAWLARARRFVATLPPKPGGA